MAENQVQEAVPLEDNEDIQNLRQQIDATNRKNKELLEEKRRYVKIEKSLESLGEGTDVDSLIEFKRNAEQTELEAKGDYAKARQALEQQFREATKEKDERIKELETKIKDLELIAPALSALAPLVHDTDYAMNALGRDNFEVQEDGTVCLVNGYDRLPVKEAVEKILAGSDKFKWVVKQSTPQGGGAPVGRSSGAGVPPGTKNPFSVADFNLSEQSRLYLRDRDMYERLKAAASR